MRNPWIASLSLVLVAAVAPCASADLIFSGSSHTAGPSSLTSTVVLITNTGDEPVSQTVAVTDVDFTIPTGTVFGQYVAAADFVTGSGSITLSGYVDTTNTPNLLDPSDFLHGAETLIGTADESTVPFTALVPLTLSGAYGLTLIVNLTLGPLSSLSYTHTVSVIPAAAAAVPEPSTAALLTAALLAVGVIGRHRLRPGVAH